MIEHKIIKVDIRKIKPYKNNARLHSTAQIKQIMASIKEFGFTNPLIIDSDFNLIAGHGRVEAIKQLNSVDFKDNPILSLNAVVCDGLSEAQKRALVIADNKIALNADWDFDILVSELKELDNLNFDLNLVGFSNDEITDMFNDINLVDKYGDNKRSGVLKEAFIIPPFSILNTTQKDWVERRKSWDFLGYSGDGRDDNLLGLGLAKLAKLTGTSIFDPVLCELMLKWFNIPNGSILDCFAGGSTRGLVSAYLGYSYVGVDLREEQIECNKIHAKANNLSPVWLVGDSINIKDLVKDYNKEGNGFDMILSCPPYFDLEVYSNSEQDLSNMSWDKFKEAYATIIKNTCDLLKDNRFAVFVVGEVRDKKGAYINFVDFTKACFLNAGLCFYNDIILVNSVGTGAIRCAKPFNASRKVLKRHQNVLVFYKGDIKCIKDNFKSFYGNDDFNEFMGD